MVVDRKFGMFDRFPPAIPREPHQKLRLQVAMRHGKRQRPLRPKTEPDPRNVVRISPGLTTQVLYQGLEFAVKSGSISLIIFNANTRQTHFSHLA